MEIGYLADHLDFALTLAGWHYEQWKGLHENDSVGQRIEFLKAGANRLKIPAVFVAIENGELRGSATLAASDMETRRELTPWMIDVYVAPQWRRRGIASQLVHRVVVEAAALKVAELYLFTTGPWREQLHAGLGWSVIDRPIYLGIERVLMSIHPA
jgi:GNAT superfamily N-acetyltransferase